MIGRLGARLILQQAREDVVTEFLGRARSKWPRPWSRTDRSAVGPCKRSSIDVTARGTVFDGVIQKIGQDLFQPQGVHKRLDRR